MTSFLADYRTERELAAALKERLGFGTVRMLRYWRQQRRGPPWAKFQKLIVYPNDKFDEWLAAQVQQPVRSRRDTRARGETVTA
jgi:hypothetical protein